MADEKDEESGLLTFYIPKEPNEGYGYNVKGPKTDGGPVKCINGQFYAPMPLVTRVLIGSPAHRAGLRVGDLICEVNGQSLEGVRHATAVLMLKSCEQEMTLSIVRPLVSKAPIVDDDDEAMMDDRVSKASSSNASEEISNNCANNRDDHNQKTATKSNKDEASSIINSFSNATVNTDDDVVQKYIPKRPERYVSIPGFMKASNRNDSYIAYHIYIDNKYMCSRRFSDFKILEECLKENFHHKLPQAPGRRFFTLSEKQLEDRMGKLETFLQAVCSKDDIFESDILKEFLQPYYGDSSADSSDEQTVFDRSEFTQALKDKESTEPHTKHRAYLNHTKNSHFNIHYNNTLTNKKDANHTKDAIKVLLPDRSLLLMDIHPLADVTLVHNMVAEHLDLSSGVMAFFALYEHMPDAFERKLTKDDLPYFLYKRGLDHFKELANNCPNGKEESGDFSNADSNKSKASNGDHRVSSHQDHLKQTNPNATNKSPSNHNKSKQTHEGFSTNIFFKKWVFSKKIEARICNDPTAMRLIFEQARECELGSRGGEVQCLVESDQRAEALKLIREADHLYNSVTFPHCSSDSRKHGHVILSLSFDWLRLHACTIKGEKEDNSLALAWGQVKDYKVRRYTNDEGIKHNGIKKHHNNYNTCESDEEYEEKCEKSTNGKSGRVGGGAEGECSERIAMEFVFTFEVDGKPSKTVALCSAYSGFMFECFQRIEQERQDPGST